MSSTVLPATKLSLLGMLQALAPLTTDKVDVRYAESFDSRRDAVWLGDLNTSTIERRAMRSGSYRREEDFEIPLFILVTEPTGQIAEVKAFNYLAAIEEALAADPKLSETSNLSWALISGFTSEVTDTGEGVHCEIEATVLCKGYFS